MNIAIFASAFYPSLGGVEELCRQLALELMRQGHGVIVLTNRWPRDLPATETLDGIAVYRLPFRLPEGSAKAAINYHLTHRRIEREMLTILRSHKIDILHVQCVSSNAHYAMIAQEKLHLPLVVTLQGELTMDANQIFQKSPQAQEILRRSLDRADLVTACSGKTLRDGEEFYGKPFGDRGRVVFNGVNLADFATSTNNEQRTTNNGDGGFTTKTQRHEGRGDGVTGYGLQGTGLAGQPAGRGPAGAGQIESAALPNHSRFEVLGSDSSSRPPYIFALGRMAKQKGFDVLIQAYAALRFNDQRSMNSDQKQGDDAADAAKNSEFRTLHSEGNMDAAPIESGALPQHSRFEVLGSYSSSSAALPKHSRFEVLGSGSFPTLVLAGDGPELEPLKALARELGLADCVHFPGRADHAAVVRYMQGCEFFVLSSRADEGLPVVCAEAMGAGCAIVATRSGGAPEAVLDGQTGLLVDKENVEQLAAAMQRLIGNPELRKHLAVAGKARAAEFAWPVIAQQYLAAYAAAAAASAENAGARS
ncbi:MAG: glycosyltransferase family 4 protein [Phycisphaerae bacterium]